MAINRIDFPASTPIAVADYQAQNTLIQAAFSESANVFPWSGTAMSVGFVFQVGGTVYKVDTATTISGTASPYVKITPSGATATASFVASLAGVSWTSVYNGYYDGSGNRYFFDEARATVEGVITTPKTLLGKVLSLPARALGVNAMAIANGGSVGVNAYSESGGAVGWNSASYTTGGAIGAGATTYSGGSVGQGAVSTSGFSGGAGTVSGDNQVNLANVVKYALFYDYHTENDVYDFLVGLINTIGNKVPVLGNFSNVIITSIERTNASQFDLHYSGGVYKQITNGVSTQIGSYFSVLCIRGN